MTVLLFLDRMVYFYEHDLHFPHTSPEPNINVYINNENMDIVFLIISHSNYFMEFKNQKKRRVSHF